MMINLMLAILLSLLLLLQPLTFGTALTANESMQDQYGSMQTTTYPNVDLQWTPTKPTAGQDVTFTIIFRNQGSSMPKSHIDYTFTIMKDGNTVYTVSQHTHSGKDIIKQKLATDGVHKITITITGIDFKSVQPRESDFSITVQKPSTQEQTQEQAPQKQPKEMKGKEEPNKPVKEEQKPKAKKSEERHMKHLAKKAPIVVPYTANMNYTLTASGKATSISDNSTSADAKVSMNLSVWKSTKGLVAMDVIGGTVKIGQNETYDILAGNALYLIKAHRMIVHAFTAEDNSTKPLTLKARVSLDLELPYTKSDNKMQFDILSPQSKLSSKWFLKMDGEINLS